MSQTELDQSQTNELTLDRATGRLVGNEQSFTTGAGCAVESWVKTQKVNDNQNVNNAPAEKETNSVDLTIVDNTTGATTHITGDATVGVDYEHTTWAQISMPKAMKAVLAYMGATSSAGEAAIISMLQEAADNGGDWDAAFATVVGNDMTEAQSDRADGHIKSLKREVAKTSKGRQQFTSRTA